MGEPAGPPEGRDGAVVLGYVHEKTVTYSWHHSMIELIGWDLQHEQRILRGGYVAMHYGTDGLVSARNKAVRLFLDDDVADWFMWIDTDMGFAPDMIDRLFDAADPVDRPVVGALAFTQREEESDGMGGWRCRATPTVFDWTTIESTGEMGFSVRWNYPHDALTRVAATGCACVLVHRSVFERLESSTALSEDGEPLGPHWYDRIFNTTMGQTTGEDMSFCLRALALGIPIHVHTGVKTSHQKTLWLSETDYYGQVLLSKIPPRVPKATEKVAVIVPTLGRPHKAVPFMQSLAASGAPTATVYAVADKADAQAWEDAGARVIVWDGGPPGTFAQRANLGYRETAEPWLFLVGDDVLFHAGWLDQALWAARDGACVVGTNDLHNPRVTAGDHATHMLVRRSYVDEVGGSWDGPGVLCHEYQHWFVDDELVTAAKQRGVWAPALHAKVEHFHPIWGNGEDDATYRLGQSHADADRERFKARLAEFGPRREPAGA